METTEAVRCPIPSRTSMKSTNGLPRRWAWRSRRNTGPTPTASTIWWSMGPPPGQAAAGFPALLCPSSARTASPPHRGGLGVGGHLGVRQPDRPLYRQEERPHRHGSGGAHRHAHPGGAPPPPPPPPCPGAPGRGGLDMAAARTAPPCWWGCGSTMFRWT